MRIAVASDDRISIAGHFGRCAGFLVFDIDKAEVKELDYRLNSFGHHQHGLAEHHHGPEHDDNAATHSHAGFIEALADCEVVICRGMGRRAVADLAANGITPAITSADILAREAAEMYAKGDLNTTSDSSCCTH